MQNLRISAVTKQDLPEILHLARQSSELNVFPSLSKEGQKTLLESLEKNTLELVNRELYQALTIRTGTRLLGYVALRNHCYLAQLFVDFDSQGQGIGTMLLDKIVTMVSGPTLKVRASINSVGFYKRYGFRVTGAESEINHIRFLPMEYKVTNSRE